MEVRARSFKLTSCVTDDNYLLTAVLYTIVQRKIHGRWLRMPLLCTPPRLGKDDY